MHKYSKRTATCAIFFLLILAAACRRSQDHDTAQVSAAGPAAGDLHVIFTSPQRQTMAPHESESVLVVFDRAMITLKALSDKPAPALIEFEPRISGEFQWLNPKTLRFRPKNRFPYATRITAGISAGLRSIDGYELREGVSWDFLTIRPLLIRHFPKNKQRWLELDTETLLIFNLPIRADKAAGFVSFIEIDPDSGIETAREFKLKRPSSALLEKNRISAPAANVLLLKPDRSLRPGRRYVTELIAGLPGAEGTLGMEKGKLFEFSTFTPFRFSSLEAGTPHNPRESLRFVFSNPVSYRELIDHIHFDPEIAIPESYRNWDQSNNRLWLSLPFEPETEYQVSLDPELADRFGNPLGGNIRETFKTSPYTPSIDMTTGHGILESKGDLRYPLYAVNTARVQVQAGRIPVNDAVPLLADEERLWSKNRYREPGFFAMDEILPLNQIRNAREIFPIEIGRVCPDRSGLVLLQLVTDNPNEWSRYPKVFLQVTNMGITGKYSRDNTVIWVTTLDDGLPVSGARVEIRDDANHILWRGASEADGRCQAPGWKELGLKPRDRWSRPRLWVIARFEKDTSLTSSEWETGVYPYSFGIHYDWNPEPEMFRGQIFSERGIYRAGETIHLKGIVRSEEQGEWISPAGMKIRCRIQDPFDKPVMSRDLILDEFGSWNLDFESREDAALGHYRVFAALNPESKGGASAEINGSFRLEAFRPAEFEIHLRSGKEAYVFGDEYAAELRAVYLFGGAMASQDLSWHLRLNPTDFRPPGFEGFRFGLHAEPWEDGGGSDSRLISSGSSRLDSGGRFQLKADLVPEKERGAVTASLEATVSGPSRRTISNRIRTLVHRGAFYIGIQSPSRFLEAGEDLACRLLAVTPEGEVLSGRRLELRLVRREWRSVRKSEMGGRFRWISEREDIEVARRSLRSRKDPVETSFRIEKAGTYVLTAESSDDRKNPVATSTTFYATGSDYIAWERRDDDSIDLIPDRSSYQPGDTARLLIKSPYERAQALVTVEREHILESRVIEVSGSSFPLDIPIRSEHIPNIFISVLLVQGRTAEESADREQDMGKPAFKLGYAELAVNPEEKRLAVKIQDVRKTYRPGDEVTLEFQVKNRSGGATRACLSVAVVDAGVLNLIGYTTPDPFSLFYRPKPLSVQTSEIRHLVVGQRAYGEKGDEVGGGSGETARAASMPLSEVELRGDFRFTAFWNPSLVTDSNGRARAIFRLPDNLSTFRVMAVAQTDGALFGRGQTSFRVSKPILMQAACPRFTRMGDEFSGGVVVHNQSGRDGRMRVACSVEGLAFSGPSEEREFELEEGQSREILFAFRALQPGKAVLRFKADLEGETDGLEISFPVRLPRPRETVALAGQTRESTVESITIPESGHPGSSRLRFQASSTALSGLEPSLSYLRDYPYLCLEQRISAVLPFLVARDIIRDFRLTTQSEEEIQSYVIRIIKEIGTYQLENGGFGLWPDSKRDSPFNSCYAGYALIQARSIGIPVDNERLSRLAHYLRAIVRGRRDASGFPYSKSSWETTRAYSLYILTLLGQPDSSSSEALFQVRNDMTPFGRILLLKSLSRSGSAPSSSRILLRELENRLKVNPTTAHVEEASGGGRWIYSSTLRSTALMLQALIETGVDNPLIPSMARWLVERRSAGGWSSTQDHCFAFQALNDYYRHFDESEPDFRLTADFGAHELLKYHFGPMDRKIHSAELSLSDWESGRVVPLAIDKQGPGLLHYQARLSYAPAQPLAARDRGFTIYKSYTTLDGRPVEQPRAGQLVVVTLQIVIPQERLFVVVEDPLPAGIEAMNPDFQTTSREDLQRLESSRLKSERFWWVGFNHIELHDDRVLLFADSLPAGVHVHRYLARALSFGDFTAPGPMAREMYAPEVFGRGSEEKISIKK